MRFDAQSEVTQRKQKLARVRVVSTGQGHPQSQKWKIHRRRVRSSSLSCTSPHNRRPNPSAIYCIVFAWSSNCSLFQKEYSTRWRYEAMKQFLKITLLLPLALAGSMLIAQDDPDAKRPPEKGQAEQNSQRATVGKSLSQATASTC